MYEISYGPKYDKSLNTTQIAARVRAEVKEATKKDGHPLFGCKVSITTQYFAGGSSIHAYLTGAPFMVGNPAALWDNLKEPNKRSDEPCYTIRASAAIKALEVMMGAYNYDGSEIQTDYFNVNFYGSAGVNWKFEHAERDGFKALVESGKITERPTGERRMRHEQDAEINLLVFGPCPQCPQPNNIPATGSHMDFAHNPEHPLNPPPDTEPVVVGLTHPVNRKYHTDGTRLTDCCGSFSTYFDDTLCCKTCKHEVPIGQGDGSEHEDGTKDAIIGARLDLKTLTATPLRRPVPALAIVPEPETDAEIVEQPDQDQVDYLVALGVFG